MMISRKQVLYTQPFFLIFFIFLSNPTLSVNRRVHVFGDSHASFCFSNERNAIPRDEISSYFYINERGINDCMTFLIHWLGPKTMFSVGRDGISSLDIKKYGVQESDIVVFVLGEIDARCHIGKQRDIQKVTLDQIVGPLVNSFIKVINDNRIFFTSLTCVIVSVVPPTNNAFNIAYPQYGPLQDRVVVTNTLNQKLKEKSRSNGIYYLDIHTMLATGEGILNNTLSDGIVHINKYYNDIVKNMLIDLITVANEVGIS